MKQVNIHEAKTHFSSLLSQVALGEEIVVAKAGKPIARLVPIQETSGKRKLGIDEGLFTVPENFNDPLPNDIVALFEGGEKWIFFLIPIAGFGR